MIYTDILSCTVSTVVAECSNFGHFAFLSLSGVLRAIFPLRVAEMLYPRFSMEHLLQGLNGEDDPAAEALRANID